MKRAEVKVNEYGNAKKFFAHILSVSTTC